MQAVGRLLVMSLLLSCPAALGAADWTNDLTPITAKEWNARRAAHLLERAGFGGTPEEVARLAALTPEQAVAYLVDYENIDASGLPPFEPSGIYPNGYKLAPIQTILRQVLTTGKAFGAKATQEGKLPYQPAINEFYTLLISEHTEMRRASLWWAERMLRTPRPLEEKLTLFWHDHFATSQEKVLNYELMMGQIETLRKNAQRPLRDLLIAVAQDPAMLVWLDNRENVKGKPNENFAREVMELFCMGEGQGYSESDIREMARAFTGWTMRPVVTVKDAPQFLDDKKQHDDGTKTFLGASGNFSGYDAIDIILKQPATPRFVAKKLYRYFVRENSSAELNAKLGARLAASNYDVKALLKMLFLSRDFYSEATVGTQIKSPVHFVVSTYRKLGLTSVPGIPDYLETTTSLGQLLFYPPNVAGWPGGRSWINPATLLTRGNFAHTLLFPDPDKFIPMDKVVAEGYRKIPQAFKQYDITPHIWNAKTQKMEPVTLAEYEAFCARLDTGAAEAMGGLMPAKKKDDAAMAKPLGTEMKSKMAQVSQAETYNLAVGVYSGFMEAYRRVKPVPRTTAEIDFVALARAVKATTPEEAVDAFCQRFLSVQMHPERRAAVVTFLKNELKSDRLDYGSKGLALALRRVVHLILSAPEYQLG